MGDPVNPPQVSDALPKDLRDFIECRGSQVTIPNGKQPWLKDYELTITAGDAPNTGTMAIGWGYLKFSFPVSVVDGRLVVDTSESHAPDELQQGLTDWAKQLNDWFAHNKKKLGLVTFGQNGTILRKVAIAPQPGQAAPPPPPAPKPEPPAAKPEPAPPPKPEPPPEPYYEPKYVTPPPLPNRELFPPGATASPPTSGGSSGPAIGGPTGPGGAKASAGLSGVAIRYIVAGIIVAVLAGAGIIALGGGQQPAAASLPPTTAPASAAASAPATTATTPAATPTPVVTPAPTTAGGGLIFGTYTITKDVQVSHCEHKYTVEFKVQDSSGQSAIYAGKTATFHILDNEADRSATIGSDGTFTAEVDETFQKTGSGCFSHLQPKVVTVDGQKTFG